MTEPPASEERAPAAIRYGLPIGTAVTFVGLASAAAFTGTADWGLALPIGLVVGGLALGAAWFTLRRRGVSVLQWLDDYWTRE